MMFRRFVSTLTKSCPSCARPLPTPLPACTTCGSISPIPPSVPFHDIFGLPSRPNPFVVDAQLLKRRFREAQAVCHPDTWASKGQDKEDVAQALSARLNEAYTSLADPLLRAEYLLEQNGLAIAEGEQLDDVEFITEIMEMREAMDEAESADEVARLVEENAGKIAETVEVLSGAVGRSEWDAAKTAAVRLKYLSGIRAAGRER
ncbi:hypothetical protein B0H15DRAFT_812611, partial [Mycena belliarum]